MTKILIIDDEPDVTRAVSLTIELQEPTWQVVVSHQSEEGLMLVEESAPDAILLDLQMPDLHGFEVLERIRLFSDVPLIILTVRDDELDKVRGLQLGADDYIVKPFGHLELVARLRAILRRTERIARTGTPFLLGDLEIVWEERRVLLDGKPIRLTATEFRLLEVLAHNAGRVIANETLLGRVWGSHGTSETDYLKTYIYRLRSKLEDDPSDPQYIFTEWGVGYYMPQPTKGDQRTASPRSES